MKLYCTVLNGQIINIGPRLSPQDLLLDSAVDRGHGISVGPDGEIIYHGPSSPSDHLLPEGAVSGEYDVLITSDGRCVLATDYRELRRCAYPSIGDQLDALYHAGCFPPDMAEQIEIVKQQYPKNSTDEV